VFTNGFSAVADESFAPVADCPAFFVSAGTSELGFVLEFSGDAAAVFAAGSTACDLGAATPLSFAPEPKVLASGRTSIAQRWVFLSILEQGRCGEYVPLKVRNAIADMAAEG
jgi:hypothetical protein